MDMDNSNIISVKQNEKIETTGGELEEFVEVEELDQDIGGDEFQIGNEIVVDEKAEFVGYPIAETFGSSYQAEYQPAEIQSGEKKLFCTSRRIKKGLENNEYYRVPLVKGNTKYSMYYDRLIHADGTSTEHYICKNYDRCGKIFHRRYLDALCSHMNECRPENLWSSEECGGNIVTNLMAKVVVRNPSALDVMSSKAYLEHIEELSRIMVMRYSIGLTIGKDALPRPKDFLREIARYSDEDECRLLPITLRKMLTNGCAIESALSSDEPTHHIILASYINNSWEKVRIVLNFELDYNNDMSSKPFDFLNLILSRHGMVQNSFDKIHFITEWMEEENKQENNQLCILHLLEAISEQIIVDSPSITEQSGESVKMQRLQVILRQIRDFAEKASRHPKLRSILKFYSSSNNKVPTYLHLAKNWMNGQDQLCTFLHDSSNPMLSSIWDDNLKLATEDNFRILMSYLTVLEPFEEAMEIFQSTVDRPSMNLVIVEWTELTNRMESLIDAEECDDYDLETIKILASAALNALEDGFNRINRNLAFCALYCDPMRFAHLNYLTRFCSIEEIRNVVFVELENLEVMEQHNDDAGGPWLSYTEEAQHYERLTMNEIFDATEADPQDPQKYCPLAFWRIYENVYPSIASLAKRILAVSATTIAAQSALESFKPMALSLGNNFDPKFVSQLIRLHSIHHQTNMKTNQLQSAQVNMHNSNDHFENAKMQTNKRKNVEDDNEAGCTTAPKKRGRPRKKS